MRTVGEVAALAGVSVRTLHLLDDPTHDRVQVMCDQARRLREERDRLQGLLEAVLDAIAAHGRGESQEEHSMFDGTDHEQHAQEAERRWGDTEAWQQSQERLKDWGPADLADAQRRWQDHFEQFAALKRDDVPVAAERVLAAVADHRALLQQFYDCGAEMQKGLADMYVADPRFAATYDGHADGLAQYVRDAVHEHADRV